MRSFLDIFDLDTGQTETLLATERLIEAPNWSPDGTCLFVNGDGLLFRVSLDMPELVQIETGMCIGLNNDHGLSPDGQMLAISDKMETGRSCIYTLPVAGGAPTRVTARVPSWWHGWSPDGARLAYTAVRDEDFCIATCALDGSDEQIVITSPHHYDGPDYTPDGEWIWFNSDRGGDMQLWRVRPDGREPQQMTHETSVNWFPHPSPCGAYVLYLAYPAGTAGHPADLNVSLRLLSVADGSTRLLCPLFGGQGSINVPCWAPDGRRFAFMRYAPASLT